MKGESGDRTMPGLQGTPQSSRHSQCIPRLSPQAKACEMPGLAWRSTSMPAAALDRLLTPFHRWIWRRQERRVQKLLRFGETETDGGRDLLRAAEVTSDPLLRRLYLVHAIDEQRHGTLFRRRASALLHGSTAGDPHGDGAEWLAPAAHGLDDLE